jgi:hypothetical protein
MCIRQRVAVILAAAALCGCQAIGADTERPARIVDADDASRAALQAAVNEALGREVRLANNALTDSSLLVIEISPPQSLDKPLPTGRDMTKPLRFQLLKSGSDCVLVNMQDDSRQVLADTRCEPE